MIAVIDVAMMTLLDRIDSRLRCLGRLLGHRRQSGCKTDREYCQCDEAVAHAHGFSVASETSRAARTDVPVVSADNTTVGGMNPHDLGPLSRQAAFIHCS